MNRNLERILIGGLGLTMAVGIVKGPQLYASLTDPGPLLSGTVTHIDFFDSTFGFGTRKGKDYNEYTILDNNGKEIFG